MTKWLTILATLATTVAFIAPVGAKWQPKPPTSFLPGEMQGNWCSKGFTKGVQNILVTHAMSPEVKMSVPEMKEAAQMGAYLEFTWVKPDSEAAKAYVPAIREVGPEFCVLSSDLGQPANPLHPDGLLQMYQFLHDHGFSVAEIDRMAKTNPAKLLGL